MNIEYIIKECNKILNEKLTISPDCTGELYGIFCEDVLITTIKATNDKENTKDLIEEIITKTKENEETIKIAKTNAKKNWIRRIN